MNQLCLEEGCCEEIAHPIKKMCIKHYALYRKNKQRENLINLEQLDPIHRAKRLEYYRQKYCSDYRELRLVKKFCICGNVALKGSLFSLCKDCSTKRALNNKIKYQLKRKKEHLPTKIRERLKSRLSKLLKKEDRGGSVIKDLGCSIDEFVKHLEDRFYPNPRTGEVMSWNNYGFYGWHIDHIKPLSLAKNEEELKKLCHYSNLQPLWAEDNFKKSDTYEAENGLPLSSPT